MCAAPLGFGSGISFSISPVMSKIVDEDAKMAKKREDEANAALKRACIITEGRCVRACVLFVFCLWVNAVGCVSMYVPMDSCRNAEEGALHAGRSPGALFVR